MPYLKINNSIELYYEIISKKETKDNNKIVLINGLGSPTTYWLDFPKNLTEFFDEVLIFDNRGIGKSKNHQKFYNLYSVDDLAEDLYQLITFLKWNSFHLFGISLGGFISLKFVEKYHKKFNINSLILASTHAGLKHLYYSLHNPFLEFIKWKLYSKEKRIEEIIKYNSGSNLKATNIELYNNLFESRKKEKVELDLDFWRQTFAGSTFFGVNYKKIEIPVLILHGKNDKVVPYQNALILEHLLINSPKKSTKIYENAGHLCIWEREKEILEEIKNFCLKREHSFV